MPNAIQHHYVSKFLLDSFCEDNSSKLFVYDLEKNGIRQQIPKEVASECNFYSLRVNGQLDIGLEDFFSTIETKAAPIIEKFKQDLPLSDLERNNLANFISLMRIRTPAFLNNAAKLRVAFEESKQFDETQSLEFTLTRWKEVRRDNILRDSFLWWYWAFLEHNILNMKWGFIKAPLGKRFITSDNPLCSIIKESEFTKNGISIIHEFQDSSLLLYLPLSKEHAWLGYYPINENIVDVIKNDPKRIEMFERNTVIWADKYLYASTEDLNILNHGMQYKDVKPFDINIEVFRAHHSFRPANIKVKRV